MSKSAYGLFNKEKSPKIREQNPDMKWGDIDKILREMWNKLSIKEKIAYYVKATTYNEAKKVFDTEMEPVLIRKGLNKFNISNKLCQMWDSLIEEERKPYIDKATMLLTQEQVMKLIPEIVISPCDIFCEEKGITQKCGPEYNKFSDIYWRLKTEEQNKYEGKAKAKEMERFKYIEPLVLKEINNAISTITKEQELKNELFNHMEKIKQKEDVLNEKEELKVRHDHLNTRENELNEREKQLKQGEQYLNIREEQLNEKYDQLIKEEELLNKRKGRLIKKEEHFHKVYTLITLLITFIVFIMTK